MPLLYNPVTDAFTYYEPIETPKVKVENPLFGTFDLSDLFSRISSSGTPIAKANTPETVEFDNSYLNRMAQTHSETQFTEPLSIESQPIETYKINLNLPENKKKAMEFFQSKGLNLYQSAGIVGNLLGESNLDPEAVNPKSKAYGIALWLGNRKKKLIAKYGNKPTFDLLLEFVWEELNSSEKSAYNKLLLTKNLEDAINSFMRHFERPSEYEMRQSINNRIKHGRGLLS